MEGTPPPAGHADAQPTLTVEQLRTAAELYLIERHHLPPHLLPSAGGGALQWMALELRTMVVRRLRLVDRLRVAAANVTAQSIELIQKPPVAPGEDGPLNRKDLAAVENLTARILELDHQIPQWVTVLVHTAAEMGVKPAPVPGQEEKSPPAR